MQNNEQTDLNVVETVQYQQDVKDQFACSFVGIFEYCHMYTDIYTLRSLDVCSGWVVFGPCVIIGDWVGSVS